MLFFIILVITITLIALFNYMSTKKNDAPAYVPPKISGNLPFPIQRKINANQEEYDKRIHENPFNMNDWLSIHPGAENLGPYGEFLTTKKTINACKETASYFKILNNLYLNTKNGSTEIDVVMIHETGIYVFESKNFSGWIYGGYKQKEWTQKIEHAQNHFYNPIWQNKGHISALKNVLGKNLPYISLIVFSERCELKNIPNGNANLIIIKRNLLEHKLVNEINQREKYISLEQVDEMYKKLQSYVNTEKSTSTYKDIDLPF